MSDRGEYRAIRTVLIDGPDWQQLEPSAKLVFLTLKLQLGPSGIGVIPALVHVLAEQTGYLHPTVKQALEMLEGSGWIRRDHNVVEIVDGLKHEPAVNLNNENHRKGLANHLAGLPNVDLVRQFRQRYLPDTLPMVSEGDLQGMPKQELGIREEEVGIKQTTPPPAREDDEAPGSDLRRICRYCVDAFPLARHLTGDDYPQFITALVNAVDRFAPKGKRDAERIATSIAGYCNGALQGMHGPQRTVEEIKTNLSDYALATIEGKPSGNHIRAFIYSDPAVRARPKSNGSNGAHSDAAMTLQAGELIRHIRAQRNPQFPTNVLPGWDANITRQEKRAVQAIGIGRILEAKPSDDAALLPQLAKALSAATIASATDSS